MPASSPPSRLPPKPNQGGPLIQSQEPNSKSSASEIARLEADTCKRGLFIKRGNIFFKAPPVAQKKAREEAIVAAIAADEQRNNGRGCISE